MQRGRTAWIVRGERIHSFVRVTCLLWSGIAIAGSTYTLLTRHAHPAIVGLAVVGVLSAILIQFAVWNDRPGLSAIALTGSLCTPTLVVFYIWPFLVVLFGLVLFEGLQQHRQRKMPSGVSRQ